MSRRFLHRLPAVLLAAMLLTAIAAGAHDTWVQASPGLLELGDVARVELYLGNHGNDHRDFRLAGKLASLEGSTLEVVGPDGSRTDLVPRAVDTGLTPAEGFWSARFVPAAAGLHCVAHTRSGIHRGKRGIKSGKTFFLTTARGPAAERSAAPPDAAATHARPLGHPLELVCEVHPVLDVGAGRSLAVRLLHHGRPLADHRVAFIPRGAVPAGEFDPAFERRTDATGRCSYEPPEGNLVLVVAHVDAPEEHGPDFDRTVYAATLVVDVPQRCRRDD